MKRNSLQKLERINSKNENGRHAYFILLMSTLPPLQSSPTSISAAFLQTSSGSSSSTGIPIFFRLCSNSQHMSWQSMKICEPGTVFIALVNAVDVERGQNIIMTRACLSAMMSNLGKLWIVTGTVLDREIQLAGHVNANEVDNEILLRISIRSRKRFEQWELRRL